VATVRGSLHYEARLPSAKGGEIRLDRVESLPAAGLLALVVDADGRVTGWDRVGRNGDFAIGVDGPASGDERLVFSTLWSPDADGARVTLAVLDGPGGQIGTFGSRPWAWSAPVAKGGDAGDLVISEAQGAGALYLFLFTTAAMESVLADLCGGNAACLRPLAVLWHPGASWSCGSCFSRGTPQQVGEDGSLFLDQSIFVGGEEGGGSAWAFPVILHEFGHYVAANHSRDDSPGGPHDLGERIPAPFAWSEGWASFFACGTFSRWLGEPYPVYWDLQEGRSFWIDYDRAAYAGGDLQRPDPRDGLAQDLDESYVASMIWHLWDGRDLPEGPAPGDGTALGMDRVLAAVGSDRFRRYDRGATGADFVDFVDAVLCAGDTHDDVVGTVQQYLGFPYDGRPGCP